MSDLKSPWDNQPAPTPDAGGQGVLSRGGEPIDTGGASGLDPMWENAPVPTPSGPETSNPVSGLPTQPSRWEPSGTPPAPPDLRDWNPGTITEK